LAHNENTAEQVEYQLAVAGRVKVKLTKACLLEFCFGDSHFASSSSSRCILRRASIPMLRGRRGVGLRIPEDLLEIGVAGNHV
jgi:hypothetical protein